MQSLRSRLANIHTTPRPGRPIPIALVITDLDVGGAERALTELAIRLPGERWSPSVICLGPEGDMVEPLLAARVPVHCLSVNRRQPIRSIARLAASLRTIQPALVQSFLFHANLASKLAAPFAGRPWVVGGIRVAERRNRWHLELERRTQRLSAGSICVSEGVRRHAIQVGKLDPRRLAVIPNGIDASRLDEVKTTDRKSLGIPEGRIALFVGRIDPQKGVATLLDAVRIVGRGHDEWRFVLAGDGPSLPELKNRTENDDSLRDRIVWLGRRDDIPALMRASDLVVLPSLWEGMPNVILEAMAARRAVVATRVEGSEDLVIPSGPDRTGWLAEPGDPESLAACLSQAMTQPQNLRSFGDQGRLLVERRFSMDRVIAEYEQIWSAVLGYNPPGATSQSEFQLKSTGMDVR